MNEIHVSVETVGLFIGIVAVIAPAAYAVGRFHQRLTAVEKSLEDTLRRTELIAERIAAALETLVSHAAREHFRKESEEQHSGR